MTKRTHSPQEKKDLSFAKDRRNCFGENDKASRKNIPRTKAKEILRERHEKKRALNTVLGARSEDQQVAAEITVHTSKPRQWRKVPDRPLAEHLAAKSLYIPGTILRSRTAPPSSAARAALYPALS